MEKVIIGIYGIKNKINSKIYIGSSKHILRRFKNHKNKLNRNKHESHHLQNAWNKYSENNFELCLLKTFKKYDLKILFKWEQFYYDKYNSYDFKLGYNGSKRASIPISNNLGRKRADTILLNKKRAKVVYQYDVDGNFINKWSNFAEAREKFKINLRITDGKVIKTSGGFVWKYEKNYFDKTIINSRYKPVIQYNLKDEILKEWHNIAEASRKLKIAASSISNVCRKVFQCKTAGGYKWEYKK